MDSPTATPRRTADQRARSSIQYSLLTPPVTLLSSRRPPEPRPLLPLATPTACVASSASARRRISPIAASAHDGTTLAMLDGVSAFPRAGPPPVTLVHGH